MKQIRFWNGDEVHDSSLMVLSAEGVVSKAEHYNVNPNLSNRRFEYAYDYSQERLTRFSNSHNSDRFDLTYIPTGELDSIKFMSGDSLKEGRRFQGRVTGWRFSPATSNSF